MSKIRLKLYITGQTDRSQLAVDNLQQICAEQITDQYDLAIINILEQPEQAVEDHIVATPTAIRLFPDGTKQRIIGDLSQAERVIEALDLYLD